MFIDNRLPLYGHTTTDIQNEHIYFGPLVLSLSFFFSNTDV